MSLKQCLACVSLLQDLATTCLALGGSTTSVPQGAFTSDAAARQLRPAPTVKPAPKAAAAPPKERVDNLAECMALPKNLIETMKRKKAQEAVARAAAAKVGSPHAESPKAIAATAAAAAPKAATGREPADAAPPALTCTAPCAVETRGQENGQHPS